MKNKLIILFTIFLIVGNITPSVQSQSPTNLYVSEAFDIVKSEVIQPIWDDTSIEGIVLTNYPLIDVTISNETWSKHISERTYVFYIPNLYNGSHIHEAIVFVNYQNGSCSVTPFISPLYISGKKILDIEGKGNTFVITLFVGSEYTNPQPVINKSEAEDIVITDILPDVVSDGMWDIIPCVFILAHPVVLNGSAEWWLNIPLGGPGGFTGWGVKIEVNCTTGNYKIFEGSANGGSLYIPGSDLLYFYAQGFSTLKLPDVIPYGVYVIVKDQDGNLVEGAFVQLKDENNNMIYASNTTNNSGVCVLSNNSMSYLHGQVFVSKEGYNDSTLVSITNTLPGEMTSMDIPLQEIDKAEETPGFEFELIILATIIGFIIFKKRN